MDRMKGEQTEQEKLRGTGRRVRFRTRRIRAGIRIFLRSIFSLEEGTDSQGTIDEIRSNIRIRGANIWILICSAGLASIGLDINSVAVIIGAMLISPLMSPILGIGLGVGINDRDLLFDSLKNFGIAVAASIGMSALYFLITPLGQPTAELTARTEPTLLDVGVALFGGVAGIVAGSRREKTNAVPGVAIATALMPPLCTAGFGLATGRWSFFLGAFYLFFINAVFISLSTYLVVRLLHFPYHEFPDERTRKRAYHRIIGFVVLAMAPSIVIFYSVITDLRKSNGVNSFLDDHLRTESREPVGWERIEEGNSIRYLKVYMVGTPIRQRTIDSLAQELKRYGLGGYQLKVIQMNIPEEERARLAQEATKNVLKTIEISQAAGEENREENDSLQEAARAGRIDSVLLQDIGRELALLLPEVTNLTYGRSLPKEGDTASGIPIFLFDYTRSYGSTRRKEIRERLEQFLRQRTKLDTLIVRPMEK